MYIISGYATILDQLSELIHTVPCHEGTFQRHPYESNTQCACNETKGHCNKTGQVVASNGSTTEDRTCRCDFRRGYKFSTKPSNECVCQSSSEDCTCIKEECKTEYRLSPGTWIYFTELMDSIDNKNVERGTECFVFFLLFSTAKYINTE